MRSEHDTRLTSWWVPRDTGSCLLKYHLTRDPVSQDPRIGGSNDLAALDSYVSIEDGSQEVEPKCF